MSDLALALVHDPDCGTSRNSPALLRDAGIDARLIDDPETSSPTAESRSRLASTAVTARPLLRAKGTPCAQLVPGEPECPDDERCRPSDAVLGLLPVGKQAPFTNKPGEWLADDGRRRARS
jgi:arsenate reductase